jgi:hypothetical protein
MNDVCALCNIEVNGFFFRLNKTTNICRGNELDRRLINVLLILICALLVFAFKILDHLIEFVYEEVFAQ